MIHLTLTFGEERVCKASEGGAKTIGEIAEQCCISEGRARRLLHRARTKTAAREAIQQLISRGEVLEAAWMHLRHCGPRIQRVVRAFGSNPAKLLQASPHEMLQINHVGWQTIGEIREVLEQYGLRLGMTGDALPRNQGGE